MNKSRLRTIARTLILLLTTSALAGCGGSPDQPGAAPALEPAEQPAEAATSSPKAATTEEEAAADPTADLGEPLESPERYYGVYASPEAPNRAWFVAEAKRPRYAEKAPPIPPGHLMIGAMFGDVAPWYLRSLSSTEFEQVWKSDFQPEPVRLEFELDAAGNAVALRFTNQEPVSEGRLERRGDLPEEWQ